MSEKFKGFIVTLKKDLPRDQMEPIIEAIRRLEGVADVVASVTTPDDVINRTQVRRELRDNFRAILTGTAPLQPVTAAARPRPRVEATVTVLALPAPVVQEETVEDATILESA